MLNMDLNEIKNRRKFDTSRIYRLKILQVQDNKEAVEELKRLLTWDDCFTIIKESNPKGLHNGTFKWTGHPIKWTDGVIEVKEGDCIHAFIDKIHPSEKVFYIQPVTLNI